MRMNPQTKKWKSAKAFWKLKFFLAFNISVVHNAFISEPVDLSTGESVR